MYKTFQYKISVDEKDPLNFIFANFFNAFINLNDRLKYNLICSLYIIVFKQNTSKLLIDVKLERYVHIQFLTLLIF